MAYATGVEFLERGVYLLCPFSADRQLRFRNGNLTIFSRATVTCGGGGAVCACGSAGSAVAWMERGGTFPSSSSALRYITSSPENVGTEGASGGAAVYKAR